MVNALTTDSKTNTWRQCLVEVIKGGGGGKTLDFSLQAKHSMIFLESETKSRSTTCMCIMDSRLGSTSDKTYTSEGTQLSPWSLQLILHLLSTSKNWMGQCSIWVPSSSGMSFLCVSLITLTRSNKLWASIRIGKVRIISTWKPLRTWFVTNNLTNTLKLESLTWTPHVDIAPFLCVDN